MNDTMTLMLLQNSILQARTTEEFILFYNRVTSLYTYRIIEGSLGDGDRDDVAQTIQKIVEWIQDDRIISSEIIARLDTHQAFSSALSFLGDTITKMPPAGLN